MITDACVPLSRLSELITVTRAALDASWLPAPIIAHAGMLCSTLLLPALLSILSTFIQVDQHSPLFFSPLTVFTHKVMGTSMCCWCCDLMFLRMWERHTGWQETSPLLLSAWVAHAQGNMVSKSYMQTHKWETSWPFLRFNFHKRTNNEFRKSFHTLINTASKEANRNWIWWQRLSAMLIT